MTDTLRSIYWDLLKILPTIIVVNIENLFTYKRLFRKSRIDYFGEKIQWLKLYGNLEKYEKYADKYKVREYIKETIGEQYLIKLLGVYDKAENIPYETLPNKFVIKANHGSGYNIIVKDKASLDIKKTNRKLNKWLREDYSRIKKEKQYKNIKRKLLIEEYKSDKNDSLLDYKFFCFNGKPKFIKIDFDRYSNHAANFYDTEWNLLKLKEKGYENYSKNFDKPKNNKEMIKIVNKLCKDFQFVRVDLYNIEGKIYFGELTFTPASGKHPFVPLEKDKEIASMIEL